MVGGRRPGVVIVAAVLIWSGLVSGPSATAATGSAVRQRLTSSATGYTFTQVSAGNAHTCGVRTTGSVRCWGYNYYGQATPPLGSFTSVSAGRYHTCGVKTDGTVACWGDDTSGQATPPSGSFTRSLRVTFTRAG